MTTGSLQGPLVPLNLVLAEDRAAWLREALRDAARLVGELRPCNTCGQEIAVFYKRGNRLYFTTSTGRDHTKECAELAVQRMNEREPQVLSALEHLKSTGMLAVGLFGSEDDE